MRRVLLSGIAVVGALVFLVVMVAAVGSDVPPVPRHTVVPAGLVCATADGNPGTSSPDFSAAEWFVPGTAQIANARAVVAAGDRLGVPERARVIAVAAAMQESKLLVHANRHVPASLVLPHERVGSDHDSIGLFQQRAGWGTARARMDPMASAGLFYEALLAIPGWERLPLTQAAQRVQGSAFPDAYARWEEDADELVRAVVPTECRTAALKPDGDPLHVDPRTLMVLVRAVSQVGVPYVWGGGNAHGPTAGAAPEAARSRQPGFDCSGLMVFAFGAAGVAVPHQTRAIWSRFGPPITDPDLVRAGDMILLSRNGRFGGIHHVGLYLGDGRVVHAPRPGKPVTVSHDIWNTAYWSGEFIGAVRAIPVHDRRPRPAAEPP